MRGPEGADTKSLLGAAEELGEKAGLVLVSLATIVPWDSAHDLVYVLAAACPRHFPALTAYNRSAHSFPSAR